MFTCLIVLATLQFQRRLLDTRKAMPRLDKLLLFHLVATPCLLPALLLRYSAGMMAGGVMVLSSMVCILAAAAVSLRRRTPYSLAFTVGFGILMAGAILTQLTTFGMVPAGLALLVMSKADYGGIMLEAMYFTLMLASLVRKLRVERDSAAAKERFSQQFIANVSHEMRTPLNAIIGFAEANDQSDDPVLWRKGNRMILKESEHLLFQINQVLDLARLQAGRLAIEAEPFGLDESLAHLRSLWRERAEHQGLALDLRVAGPAPPRLLGDRLRIEQVLRNLMDNAFKFTEEGTVSLVVVFKPSPGGQVPVTFTVSDTGIGIPEAKQAEIFGEFVQADAGITRRYGGSGLGVSISRRLVEAMGGRLELHSRVGEGSRFSFTLVLGACPAPAAAVVPALPAGPASGSFRGLPARRPRILIVDDQETNRQVAAVHLGKLPVDLDEAEDGLAALARLSERRYDLILLDFYMPGLGGFELARRIRAHPEWTGLPILGLTASSDAADLAEARAAGMDGVLVKPIRRAQLTEQVLALLPELAARADP
jgi:signal transduction histidine kinase/ActR/RegA family two-component response regulator